MTFFYNLNKKLKEVLDTPKSENKQLNESAAVGYSEGTKKADLSPGEKIWKDKLALQDPKNRRGSQDWARRAQKQGWELNDQGEWGRYVGGKWHPKYDTSEGAYEDINDLQEEGLPADKTSAQNTLNAMSNSNDQDMIRDLQKKAGVPVTGKVQPQQPGQQPMAEDDMEEGNAFGKAVADAKKDGIQPGEKIKVGGKTYPVKESNKSASNEQEVHEAWDDMLKDVERRAGEMKKGEKVKSHKGEIEKIDGGIRHTRDYNPKTGETDTDQTDTDKEQANSERRGRGRPRGSKRSTGAKGPSGKSKLMTKEQANMMKHSFVILDKSLLDQIADMNGAEVDPDAGTVDTWNENTARQLIAFAQKNPKRLKQAQSMNTAGMKPMAQPVGGTASGPEYNLKEEGDLKAAMKLLKKAGYKVEKAQELDEKAVSVAQQQAAGVALSAKRAGKKPSGEGAAAQMADMSKKELEKLASTKHAGLPKKKKKEDVGETTVSGSVATATDTPKSKSKGGVTFGKGIYDSLNRELEGMIAESMNVSVNMSVDEHGEPRKSVSVNAEGEDAEKLAQLLNLAGIVSKADGHSDCGCGTTPCSCDEMVDENAPDWPTQPETTGGDDPQMTRWAGGLNKPKETGQTTAPVVNRDPRRGSAGPSEYYSDVNESADIGMKLYQEYKSYKAK